MMIQKSLYIETTIPSYATARKSKDEELAGMQVITTRFWERYRQRFRVFTGEPTIRECGQGDPDAARRRKAWLEGIALLPFTEEAKHLAAEYQKLLNIPGRAEVDCQHLAICVLNCIDLLLSWNMRHLGLQAFVKLEAYHRHKGLWTPALVTPVTIRPWLGGTDDEERVSVE